MVLHRAKKIKICLFFVILLAFAVISFAQANPPTPQTTSEYGKGIQIVYPKFNYIEYGTNFSFHIHAFNGTNHILTNETTNCTFHLYNSSGNHVLKQIMFFDDPFDFEVIITPPIFKLGYFSYIVQCQTYTAFQGNQEAGFVSDSFKVTMIGEDDINKDTTAGLAITIFIILIAIFFLVIPFVVDEFAQHQILNLILKRSFIAVSYTHLTLPTTPYV